MFKLGIFFIAIGIVELGIYLQLKKRNNDDECIPWGAFAIFTPTLIRA